MTEPSLSSEFIIKITLDNLISIRKSIVDLYVNEANGIWQRFNFIIVVQTAFSQAL
jgi:hypothetical protein